VFLLKVAIQIGGQKEDPARQHLLQCWQHLQSVSLGVDVQIVGPKKTQHDNIFTLAEAPPMWVSFEGGRTNWQSVENSARQYPLHWRQHLQCVSLEGGSTN